MVHFARSAARRTAAGAWWRQPARQRRHGRRRSQPSPGEGVAAAPGSRRSPLGAGAGAGRAGMPGRALTVASGPRAAFPRQGFVRPGTLVRPGALVRVTTCGLADDSVSAAAHSIDRLDGRHRLAAGDTGRAGAERKGLWHGLNGVWRRATGSECAHARSSRPAAGWRAGRRGWCRVWRRPARAAARGGGARGPQRQRLAAPHALARAGRKRTAAARVCPAGAAAGRASGRRARIRRRAAHTPADWRGVLAQLARAWCGAGLGVGGSGARARVSHQARARLRLPCA